MNSIVSLPGNLFAKDKEEVEVLKRMGRQVRKMWKRGKQSRLWMKLVRLYEQLRSVSYILFFDSWMDLYHRTFRIH